MPTLQKSTRIRENYISFGCDPELFFTDSKGKVIGAEKVIPKDGLEVRSRPRLYGASVPPIVINAKGVVLDGVQAELQPAPTACRANLANEIASTFWSLRERIQEMKDVRITFKSVVDVELAELESLSDQAKVFGCAPSFNLYDTNAHIPVDPRTYLKRSAGGHIHMGLGWPIYLAETSGAGTTYERKQIDQRQDLVHCMDILVGNTCVMLDREPLAAERRKVYGRAGEYRLPKHGLEYRTLSNFWLRAYPLFSLVLGLSRIATGIIATSTGDGYYTPAPEIRSELFETVKLDRLLDAINLNDANLARQNWDSFQPYLRKYLPNGVEGATYGTLTSGTLDKFTSFLDTVMEQGLETVFPEDPLDHWSNLPECHVGGWETFFNAFRPPTKVLVPDIQVQA